MILISVIFPWIIIAAVCPCKSCWKLAELWMIFVRTSNNLYHRVRSLFFLYAIHRFHLPRQLAGRECGRIPLKASSTCCSEDSSKPSASLTSNKSKMAQASLSARTRGSLSSIGFSTLADQVRKSVRTVRGNQWMFRTGHPADLPLRLRKELLSTDASGLIQYSESEPACAWTFRIVAGATSSSWAWIFRRGSGHQRLDRFSGCEASTPRLSRRSTALCASSISQCCVW